MKRLQKKLALNRETVRTLSNADMTHVAGGTDTDFGGTKKMSKCKPCGPDPGTRKSECYSCTPICNFTDVIVE